MPGTTFTPGWHFKMNIVIRCRWNLTLLCIVALCDATAYGETLLVIDSVVLSPLDAAEVPAQQVGMLREIVVEEGATVEAGQVLARLDTRQAELDVAKARIEAAQAAAKANNRTKVAYAEKSLEVAQAELKRSQESIAQFAKSISQSQIDVERLTVEKLTLEKKQAEHGSENAFSAVASAYLSPAHRDQPDEGCVLAALGAEAARRGSPVRGAFTQGVRSMVDALTRLAPGKSKRLKREKALATFASMVGAIILARAVDDTELSDEVLQSVLTSIAHPNSPS